MLLNDVRLITGLLKEALFAEKPVNLKFGDKNYTAVLDKIEDDSPRVLEARKAFFLRVSNSQEIHIGQEVSLHVDFSRFSVAFKNIVILSVEVNRCEISCPKEAVISNRRSSERLNFPDSAKAEVVVQSDGVHSRGQFSANDHSDAYIGGFLRVQADQLVNSSTLIHGRVVFGKSYIDINSKVSSYVQVRNSDNYAYYRVALKNFERENEVSNDDYLNRREHNRLPFSVPLVLLDFDRIDVFYEGSVVDCSLSGFAWECRRRDSRPVFVVGAVIETQKPKLRVRFLGLRSKYVYAFEILKASVEDRHAWMELLTEASGFDYKVSQNSEAEKIISLFIESGALATGYVNANKGLSPIITGAIQEHGPYLAGLLHRWRLPRGEGSSVDTLASAFRISDSVWMIGDIAAKIYSDAHSVPMDRRTFVHAFIESFSHFCETLSPCPEISILFTEGHPFWKDFYTHLSACKKFKSAKISYFRFDGEIQENSDLQVRKIRGRDWEKIDEFSKLLSELNISSQILDAEISSFGSPIIASLFDKFNFDFERVYYQIEGSVTGFLVVNKFSPAITLNQTVNCVWFFPHKIISNFEALKIKEMARRLSLAVGSSAPGLIVPNCACR